MRSREELNRDSIRAYLETVARSVWPAHLRAKFGLSDVVQETLVRAHQNFDQFNGSGDQRFRGWLRGILLNTGRDWIRSYGAQLRDAALEQSLHDVVGASAARLEELLGEQTDGPDARMLFEEKVARLANSLPHLPETQRQAVMLRYIEGLKYQQVADRMGVNISAVSGLIRRALENLRDLLSDWESTT